MVGIAVIIIMFPAERWRSVFFFFCRVPELVCTFRWHCYPACFLRPPAFVSLSPIVPASFVPRLQQWLFFPASLYICALFALVCSVCFVLLFSSFCVFFLFLLLQSREAANIQTRSRLGFCYCSFFLVQTCFAQPLCSFVSCLFITCHYTGTHINKCHTET